MDKLFVFWPGNVTRRSVPFTTIQYIHGNHGI